MSLMNTNKATSGGCYNVGFNIGQVAGWTGKRESTGAELRAAARVVMTGDVSDVPNFTIGYMEGFRSGAS